MRRASHWIVASTADAALIWLLLKCMTVYCVVVVSFAAPKSVFNKL
jgi:hypothetical protein